MPALKQDGKDREWICESREITFHEVCMTKMRGKRQQ